MQVSDILCSDFRSICRQLCVFVTNSLRKNLARAENVREFHERSLGALCVNFLWPFILLLVHTCHTVGKSDVSMKIPFVSKSNRMPPDLQAQSHRTGPNLYLDRKESLYNEYM